MPAEKRNLSRGGGSATALSYGRVWLFWMALGVSFPWGDCSVSTGARMGWQIPSPLRIVRPAAQGSGSRRRPPSRGFVVRGGSIFRLRLVLSPPEMTSIAGLAAELFEPVDAERAALKHVFRPVAGSEDRTVDRLLLVDVDAESSQILQPEIAVAIDLRVG